MDEVCCASCGSAPISDEKDDSTFEERLKVR
jgi:hypothetical protein